jgi:hypothetical protein
MSKEQVHYKKRALHRYLFYLLDQTLIRGLLVQLILRCSLCNTTVLKVSEREVVVLSIQSNQPAMLEYQVKTFRAFLEEKIKAYLVVIKDAPSPEIIALYKNHCNSLGLECILAPIGVSWDEWNARHGFELDPGTSWIDKGASWLHGQAINWAWQEIVIRRFPKHTVLLTEQDVFMFAKVSIQASLSPLNSELNRDLTDSCDGTCSRPCSLAGVSQTRLNEDSYEVEYFHPSFLVLDLRSLPYPNTIFFGPSTFNGSRLDTGGSTAEYLSAMAAMLEGTDQRVGVCRLQHRAFDRQSCFWEYRDKLGLPDVHAEAVIHLSRSSGWSGKVDDSVINARNLCLWGMLDEALARFDFITQIGDSA